MSIFVKMTTIGYAVDGFGNRVQPLCRFQRAIGDTTLDCLEKAVNHVVIIGGFFTNERLICSVNDAQSGFICFDCARMLNVQFQEVKEVENERIKK